MQHEDKCNYQSKEVSKAYMHLQVDKEVSLDRSKLQPLNHLETQVSVFSAGYSKQKQNKNQNLKDLVIDRFIYETEPQ